VCRASIRCGAIYPDGFVEQLAMLVDSNEYAARRKKGEAGELVLK